MTKKDYALIASILFEANRRLPYKQAREVLDHACVLLKRDNPSFNETKFVQEVALPKTFIKATLRGDNE